MSRGHGRLQRIILQTVNSTRYGCTVRQLAYATYGREIDPTEAQLATVRSVVDRLLEAGRVVERVMLGTDSYILPAKPHMATRQQILQCLKCDLRWASEERAPHPYCWSCGRPGLPARPYV
jgi:hypothetical protein